MNNDKTRESLKDIAELCIDGIQGYKDAAQRVDTPYLKSLFTTFAKEREGILNAINLELVTLGAPAVTQGRTDGTALGSIHKFWLDFKSVLSSDNSEPILEECKRGEKYIIDKMDDVLKNKTEMPISSIQVLQDARYTIWKRMETIENAEEIQS
jgi:uncharacterized protein (TIGR02284 family)